MEKIFKIGDSVKIDLKKIKIIFPQLVNNFIEMYGNQKHTINKIIQLNCHCGAKRGKSHSQECLCNIAGHSQLLCFSIKGEAKSSSGIFFKKF